MLAVVSEFDFATHSGLIAAFAGRGGYRGWLRRRQSTRAKIEAIGGRIEELPVRVGAFVEWCSCLRQSASEVALDRYAQLLLEHLASETAA